MCWPCRRGIAPACRPTPRHPSRGPFDGRGLPRGGCSGFGITVALLLHASMPVTEAMMVDAAEYRSRIRIREIHLDSY